MRTLTVLYDAACPLCVRCRDWMQGQAAYVTLELLPSDGPEATRRYRGVPRVGVELVVISDEGQVWIGAPAFLLCLWALVEWREWSYRLSGPAFLPLAERFFTMLSSRRRSIAAWLGHDDCSTGACRRASPPAGPYR